MPTNVLVVGSGGREHAIAWKLRQSSLVENVYVAPGNGGTAELNVPLTADDIVGLSEFAAKHDCFTVVGPEGPLAAGIVDHFNDMNLPIFGPSKREAMLETSKSYAKEFMIDHNIPTPDFRVFEDADNAIDYADKFGGNVAIKADGLAAGKGVFVCSSQLEARQAVNTILLNHAFGESGRKVVVEEKISGRECSLMTICNGRTAISIGSAKDHKRAYDEDKGPNTGGMGAFSPADDLDERAEEEIMTSVVRPAVRASNFHGFLYVGLMLTEDGPKVLEFNTRLGDPETQAILPRLESDFFAIMESMIDTTSEVELRWNGNHACTVVMCSKGYPQSPETGDKISGIRNAITIPGVTVFHSGTIKKGEDYFTRGGRVLSITGVGKSLQDAIFRAYTGVSRISWNGEHHRKDIGRIR